MPAQFLPFYRPDIAEDDIDAVVETLRSGWLTTGTKVRQFEENFARYLGCWHAVAVNSGTEALHLALEAVGVQEGDEVLVPTMTFAATAEVVLYCKAKLVLVDCRRDTMGYNWSYDSELSSRWPRAIFSHGFQSWDPTTPYPALTARVITVDQHAAYPPAFEALQQAELLPETCLLRPCKYLNNIIEQDHRFVKRRVNPGLGVGAFATPERTIQGYEVMHMLRKGQFEGMATRDVLAQNRLINQLFEVAA